jgi:hypothetical protein
MTSLGRMEMGQITGKREIEIEKDGLKDRQKVRI